MASGEGYKVFRARFTATQPGIYLAIQQNGWKDPAPNVGYGQYIYKNNVIAAAALAHSSGETLLYAQNVALLQLAANDYLTFQAYQASGSAEDIRGGTQRTWVSIVKVA